MESDPITQAPEPVFGHLIQLTHLDYPVLGVKQEETIGPEFPFIVREVDLLVGNL